MKKRKNPSTNSDICIPAIDTNLIGEILFLLLLDQYDDGVWGRSLAEVVVAYGHKEDPGSITVSCWATRALKKLSETGFIQELEKFRSYLLERQKPNGAVGMRRNIGSDFSPAYEIIVNRRHTAVAASWWNDLGGALNKAFDAIKYVFGSSSPSMAWSAVGEIKDGNEDPLTTAHVLRTLIDFDSKGLLNKLDFDGKDKFLATYKKTGMIWLYKNLIENDLWWLYRTKDKQFQEGRLRREYCHTADILDTLPEFVTVDENIHNKIINNLADIWHHNGLGIPCGDGEDVAGLATTVMFTRICWRNKDRLPELGSYFLNKFLECLKNILKDGHSEAAGWSLTLELLSDLKKNLQISNKLISRIRSQVQDTWTAYLNDNQSSLHQHLKYHPDWVQSIATNQIFPVKITSP